MRVIENFLDDNLYKEINELSIDSMDLIFQDLSGLNWNAGGTDRVFTQELKYSEILDPLRKTCKQEFKLVPKWAGFYYWSSGSFINFHDDSGYKASATIYLNDKWDKNWGGFFMWQEGKDFKAILPAKNRCVFNEWESHAVTPTINRPEKFVRRTLQLRF